MRTSGSNSRDNDRPKIQAKLQYVKTARTKCTRRCRTDYQPTRLKDEGTYFPNYYIKLNGELGKKLPDQQKLIDDSLNGWLTNQRTSTLTKLSLSTGIVYVGDKKDKSKSPHSSSWWLLQGKKKRVLVTVIHTLADITDPVFYVCKDLKSRHYDQYEIFSPAYSNEDDLSEYIEVQPILTEERKKWIEEFKDKPGFRDWNIDPEFGLQPHPTLDILFLEAPIEFNSLAPFTLAKEMPAEKSTFGLIGYHYMKQETEEDMYKLTNLGKIPSSQKLLNKGRSLSIGRLEKMGFICTHISTTSEQSSGAPLLNDQGEVFAILIGSYYDDPTESSPSTSLDLLGDVEVKEEAHSLGIISRNRNLALTTFHPGFIALFSQI